MRWAMAWVMVGTVGKFMSTTHMGMMSKPSLGGWGPCPPGTSPSTAMASFPCRSMMLVKSYFIVVVGTQRVSASFLK